MVQKLAILIYSVPRRIIYNYKQSIFRQVGSYFLYTQQLDQEF